MRVEDDLRLAYVNLEQSQSRLIEAQRVARLSSWEWDSVTDKITGSEEFSSVSAPTGSFISTAKGENE